MGHCRRYPAQAWWAMSSRSPSRPARRADRLHPVSAEPDRPAIRRHRWRFLVGSGLLSWHLSCAFEWVQHGRRGGISPSIQSPAVGVGQFLLIDAKSKLEHSRDVADELRTATELRLPNGQFVTPVVPAAAKYALDEEF